MSESYSNATDSYLEWAGTAGAADNAVIYTSPNVTRFNYHAISVTGTNDADIEATLDGTTWQLVATTLQDDVTTGGGIKVITIATGSIGVLKGKFKQIRVLQDGVTDADATGIHGIV